MQRRFAEMTSIDNRGLQTCKNGKCYDLNSIEGSKNRDYRLKKHKNNVLLMRASKQRRYNCKRTGQAESAAASCSRSDEVWPPAVRLRRQMHQRGAVMHRTRQRHTINAHDSSRQRASIKGAMLLARSVLQADRVHRLF